MQPLPIMDGIEFVGSVDWDRRLFDSLIPLPDGTSYNAYLVKGRDKVALLDTVDPIFWDQLREKLRDVPRIDYVVVHHVEQDHSGSLPLVLEKYPAATVLTSAKARGMLVDHLHVAEERIRVMADGETIDLGGKTLRFLAMPWVHWPETIVTYLPEDRVLFSCDLFGSHLATTDMYVTDEGLVYEAAQRYYAEIMMPFRTVIKGHLEKLAKLDIAVIAPSHGPLYDRPAFIMDAYRDWVMAPPHNTVVLPFVSMHGSTEIMVRHLTDALQRQEVRVKPFNLAVTDIGKLAIALVDAATLILGTPTVHLGPHPAAYYAAKLAVALKPKLLYAGLIGSYGWNSRATEQVVELCQGLKMEILEPVICRGLPLAEDLAALDRLASVIAGKHRVRQLTD
ncbi:MAG: FprA family A-type flavoprotein [Kiritimatiellia bacterium]|nr:FprA family A-type flavoprotein [Lentisphaerota bacterium]